MVDFNVVMAHRDLLEKQRRERDEFRYKHNPPGVRYWELYGPAHARRWTTTMAAEPLHLPDGWVEAEVTHLECMTRMKAWIEDDEEL